MSDLSGFLEAFASLAAALAWPLVILALAVLLREPLSKLVADIGGRVTSLSLAGMSVQLQPLTRSSIDWQQHGQDVRTMTTLPMGSDAREFLFREVGEGAELDFMQVDIGAGDTWLTSRLFLFAVLLRATRRLRAVVFVRGQSDGSARFLGLATVDEVRRRLAASNGWLEVAYAEAMAHGGRWEVSGDTGLLAGSDAESIAAAFLRSKLISSTPSSSRGERPAPCPEGWVLLTGRTGRKRVCEHASWIDAGMLRDVFAIDPGTAERQSFSYSDDEPDSEVVKRTIRREGDYVARLTRDGHVRDLIDRRALVEQVATSVAD